MNLAEYEKLALKSSPTCHECGNPIQHGTLKHHDHPGGWRVDGFAERQWLYFQCSQPYGPRSGTCRYQHSLAKLRIPGQKHEESHLHF